MAAGEKLENNENMSNNNISVNKMTPSSTGLGARSSVMNGENTEGGGMMEEVVEQVVEEVDKDKSGESDLDGVEPRSKSEAPDVVQTVKLWYV